MNENNDTNATTQETASDSSNQPLRHKMAQGLHDYANRLQPVEGSEARMDQMRGRVSGAIDSAANYIDTANLSDLRSQTEDVVRRYPLGAIAAGFALGVFAGRLFR